MSSACVGPAAPFLLLAALSLSSPASAQAMAPLTIEVDPSGQASSLLFEPGLGPPQELADETALAHGVVEVGVPFSSPFEEAVIRHEWRDGPASSFPVFLSVTLPDPTFVKLIQIEVDETPRYSEISGACLRAADTPSNAFEMFFVCRAYALRLEQHDQASVEAASRAYRAALEGWMKASYRLYVPPPCNEEDRSRCQLVTPYGVDPDLIQRLRDAIARDGVSQI